jgi:hypothetical protein
VARMLGTPKVLPGTSHPFAEGDPAVAAKAFDLLFSCGQGETELRYYGRHAGPLEQHGVVNCIQPEVETRETPDFQQ